MGNNKQTMTFEQYSKYLDERRIDIVEDAAAAREEGKEMRNFGNRLISRAEKVLEHADPGVYGNIRLSFEVSDRLNPDLDQIRADYLAMGREMPVKKGKPSMVIEFMDVKAVAS